MKCSNCHEPLDVGAAFCGNCGQPVHKTGGFQFAHAGYAPAAAAAPVRQAGEMKALIALLLGITGIVGAAFIPFVGLTFGVAGMVLATLSLSVGKRATAVIGVVLASLAILCGLASWAYAVQTVNEQPAPAAVATSVNTASQLSTPCYSAALVDAFTISQETTGCDQVAYNGANPTDSSEVYKVYASKSSSLNESGFAAVAKEILEKDVAATLPEFTIESSRSTTFAGSPAYTVLAVSADKRTAVMEAAIFHPLSTGENIFIVTHAVTERRADLQLLEAGWQWK